MKTTSRRARSPEDTWTDVRLVRECLDGNEQAWSAIVKKYRRLIYSIPVKNGFSSEDASDVFQSVCLELLKAMPRLREPQALAGWLIRVTTNKCYHHRRREARYVVPDSEDALEPVDASGAPSLDELFDEVAREQLLLDAVAGLTKRCKKLVSMLFFEFPATPYDEVAKTLGLARGSIGFIRRRCLERLRRSLEGKGFVSGNG
jgi:RNA polymerase sigma factor (sigma-70 family)